MKGGEEVNTTERHEETLTYTVAQAAKVLGISEYLTRKMIKHSELPSIKFGRLIRIPKERLHVFLNREPGQ